MSILNCICAKTTLPHAYGIMAGGVSNISKCEKRTLCYCSHNNMTVAVYQTFITHSVLVRFRQEDCLVRLRKTSWFGLKTTAYYNFVT